MKTRHYLAAIAAAQLLVPAEAEDCSPPARYASIPLTQIEGDPREYVPVKVAGVPKLMLLDTGAFFSTMSSTAANELHLQSVPANIRLYGLTGAKTEEFVSTSFEIGGMRGDGIQFMVAFRNFGATRVAGLLGASILTQYDLSIDFGAHTLDLMSPNHCDGKVVYWPERPIAVIPFKLRDRWEIVLPVTLDGREMKATLDTGATNSTLEVGKAKRTFDVEPGSADTPVVGDLNGQEGLTIWKHRFKSLSVAGLEVANPEILIIPDKVSEKVNTWSTGTMVDKKAHSVEMAPMLIGMDVLKPLHIYISYREKTLYITPASGSAQTEAKTN